MITTVWPDLDESTKTPRQQLVEIYGPAVQMILDEIDALNNAINLIDKKLALLANATQDALAPIKEKVARLEKRHTAHLHWTNMGR